jgi:malate permease and related proteins
MDKVLLITGIFLLAMILRKSGIVRERHAGMLAGYVIKVSLPCLTLMTIGSLDLKNAHFDIVVIAWLIMTLGVIVSYAVGRLVGLEEKRLRSFILATTFPNTAFIGYPFAYALFGGVGLSYAVIYDQIGMFPFFITIGFFIAGGRESLRHSLSFPPLIALIAALLLNWGGIPPSGPIAKIIGAVGWTTLPLTIFIIGLKVRLTASSDVKPVLWCLSLRMMALPALLFLIFHLLGKEGLPYKVTIMETAMPPALTTSILALKYGLDEELTVSCISLGTVISMILFSMAMALKPA